MKAETEYVDLMMDKALELANKAFNKGEVPVGCVFSKWDSEKGEFSILSTGHNLTKLKKNVFHLICLISFNNNNIFFRQ